MVKCNGEIVKFMQMSIEKQLLEEASSDICHECLKNMLLVFLLDGFYNSINIHNML